MFCPACLFLKILEFVSVVYRLLAAEYAGLPSQGHAVVSRSEFYTLPYNVASPPGSEFESFDTHTRTQTVTDSNGKRKKRGHQVEVRPDGYDTGREGA